jgi:hypothetical protein
MADLEQRVGRSLLLAVVALAGCSGGPTPSTVGDPTSAPPTTAPPSASPPTSAPPPSDADAWEVLVGADGVRGLRAYGGTGFPDDRWSFEDGVLSTIPGSAVDLVTEAAYADFELEFAWRVSDGGNSGVMYRVVESADPPWTSGPEYQVLDDAGHPDGADPTTSAAAAYDLIAPGPSKALRPVGEFNTGRIVVRDGAVEHWLNGELVVAYDWRGPDVLELVAASKFGGYPAFMAADDGRVVLQHHGELAAFRDVRIRRLEPPAS